MSQCRWKDEENTYKNQKIADPVQSGASACLLSLDYNLQGISFETTENISQTC